MFKVVNNLKNRKGFTLIELLVVLAVLAIIALIAVPKFTGIKDQARQKADYATARSIKHSMELAYAAEKTSAGQKVTVGTASTTAEGNLGDFVDVATKCQYYKTIVFTIDGNGSVTIVATKIDDNTDNNFTANMNKAN